MTPYLTIWTENSVYEVKEAARLVRRSHGEHPPTARVGEGWRPFITIEGLVGMPLRIVWSETPEGLCRATFSSTVVAIEAPGEYPGEH